MDIFYHSEMIDGNSHRDAGIMRWHMGGEEEGDLT